MRGETFDTEKVAKHPIPSWVRDHARLQLMKTQQNEINGNKGSSFRPPPQQRSLTECIESLCSDCFEKYGAAYAESFAIKWSTLATSNTLKLFQHWNYMSDDVIALEAKASFHDENKSNKVLHCHSPPSYKRNRIKL